MGSRLLFSLAFGRQPFNGFSADSYFNSSLPPSLTQNLNRIIARGLLDADAPIALIAGCTFAVDLDENKLRASSLLTSQSRSTGEPNSSLAQREARRRHRPRHQIASTSSNHDIMATDVATQPNGAHNSNAPVSPDSSNSSSVKRKREDSDDGPNGAPIQQDPPTISGTYSARDELAQIRDFFYVLTR
jgi:hypothetical protein